MVQGMLIPPLLPVNSQRRVAVLHVPLFLLLTSGLTRVRSRKRGTRVLMRLHLLQQRLLVLHRYGPTVQKGRRDQQGADPGVGYFSQTEREELSQRVHEPAFIDYANIATKGRAPTAKTSVTSTPAAKTAKQRAQAVAELDHLIGGDHKASTTDQATDNVAVPATHAKSSKVTALEVAHLK